MPVGLFDVHKDKLELAGRRHTKQKHVFILNACDGVRIFMQAQTDNEAKGWVDMINFNQEKRRKSHEVNLYIVRHVNHFEFANSVVYFTVK